MVFDPCAPKLASHTTDYSLLPNANAADQLAITHRRPPPLSFP
jgi:hypothetical protein